MQHNSSSRSGTVNAVATALSDGQLSIPPMQSLLHLQAIAGALLQALVQGPLKLLDLGDLGGKGSLDVADCRSERGRARSVHLGRSGLRASEGRAASLSGACRKTTMIGRLQVSGSASV
jgi:hypothetical protein